ncbi:hypothetical protein CCP4SC76_3290007 [Gammaproteobacteria bacterium]
MRSMPIIQDRGMLQVMLFAGLRVGEVLALRWEDIDLTKRTLTAKGTKNGTDHTMPIADPLVHVFREQQAKTGDTELVFPTGNKPNYPRNTIKRVIVATGIDFSPHDLRRTFATIAEATGSPTTMVKRLLNHTTNSDVTGGYIKTEMETLRQAVARIAAYIEAKAQGGNVVPIQARKAA